MLIRIRKSQNICPDFRQLNHCPPPIDISSNRCNTKYVHKQVVHQFTMRHMTKRVKLENVTFTLGEEPMKHIIWCEKLGKGKRHKAAKINGVLVGEPEIFHEL